MWLFFPIPNLIYHTLATIRVHSIRKQRRDNSLIIIHYSTLPYRIPSPYLSECLLSVTLSTTRRILVAYLFSAFPVNRVWMYWLWSWTDYLDFEECSITHFVICECEEYDTNGGIDLDITRYFSPFITNQLQAFSLLIPFLIAHSDVL